MSEKRKRNKKNTMIDYYMRQAELNQKFAETFEHMKEAIEALHKEVQAMQKQHSKA